MIYFLQPTDGGPIKIGFSDDVDARARQLESHYGRPLALLATMDGGRDEERAIHDRFAHLRFGRTEQFRPAAELLTFIGRPLLVDMDPDAVEVMDGDGSTVLSIKGTAEFRDWLERAANFGRVTTVQFLEHAAVHYARHLGFKEAAPKRTKR